MPYILQSDLKLIYFPEEGYLAKYVGTGKKDARKGAFLVSQVYQWPPFYLTIGLDIGCILAKYFVFDELILQFTYRLSKCTLWIPIYMTKSTNWFKEGPFKN